MKKEEKLVSLKNINLLKNGDMSVLKNEKWLMYLFLTEETNINMERISSLNEIKKNFVLNYVTRTLELLEDINLSCYEKNILEEVLKWNEVAKGGMKHQREQWLNQGYNLFVHNIGSSQIYKNETIKNDFDNQLIYTLIKTHGLIGQYIRGEVPITWNIPLIQFIQNNPIDISMLKRILYNLNYCIIGAISLDLWDKVASQISFFIDDMIIHRELQQGFSFKERLAKLRSLSIKNGENFNAEFENIFGSNPFLDEIRMLFANVDLWYVESSLYDFSFEEFIKIFSIIYSSINLPKTDHVSFERMMKDIYYQHNGTKKVNIYKKRVIEKYLSQISLKDIWTNNKPKSNPHIHYEIKADYNSNTVFFNFKFSSAAEKLIDFCMEAEKADVLYEKAIILLFDLFEFRRDKYDRFHEEEKYLLTMNNSLDYKKIILDYVVGDNVLDIGPGGGALLDSIEQKYPNKTVYGLDISQNVIDNLKKKKQLENHKWNVLYGDAFNLSDHLNPGSIDTVIFCSIIHELYSYIEYEGKKFNHNTIAKVLKSAFDILPVGGRIIIRDGIMTEPEFQTRIIRFLSEDGLKFLDNYIKDFKGRQITYKVVGQNEVLMSINDAMEFLYTYTWGEQSYVHEVNEQFGYFTPSGFTSFIKNTLGDNASVIENRHFLQEGYTTALASKIELFNENRELVQLPDSTCLIVIEKK